MKRNELSRAIAHQLYRERVIRRMLLGDSEIQWWLP